MRHRQPKKRALERLLRRIQVLRKEVVAFKESAREVWEPLDQIVPDSEVEVMDSPRAELLGILECLLNDDFEDAVRHLGEVEKHLASPEVKGSPGESAQ
jgi:hypothetical protein